MNRFHVRGATGAFKNFHWTACIDRRMYDSCYVTEQSQVSWIRGRHAEIALTTTLPRPPPSPSASPASAVGQATHLAFLTARACLSLRCTTIKTACPRTPGSWNLPEMAAHLADPVCSPAGGCSLAVDGFMKQGIDRVGSPRHPCLKALQPPG